LLISQSNYSRKENGITRISKQEWERFAKKLDVKVEEIYEEDPATTIYKNNKGNSFRYSFNSGTINIHIPDFLVDYIELLRQQNDILNTENQELREKLKLCSE